MKNYYEIENLENFTENDLKSIKNASQIIKNGGIVAFPTETVYGIGASIYIEEAIDKIYRVKNRPKDNPLIAHISSYEMVYNIISFENKIQEELFKFLANRLWPGPISFILKKSDNVNYFSTCGLDTISVRMPDNKIALKLIEFSNSPILAPSANLSGKPSCTNAKDVFFDFGENIDFIIDGGNTPIGIESTVLDLHLLDINNPNIYILRPGFITYEDIKNEIKEFLRKEKNSCELKNINVIINDNLIYKDDCDLKLNNKVLSPGIKYKHYKPSSFVILIKKDIKDFIEKESKIFTSIKEIIEKKLEDKKIDNKEIKESNDSNEIKIWVLHINKSFGNNIKRIFEKIDKILNDKNKKEINLIFRLINFNNEYELAKNYYSTAREGDKNGIDILIIEGLEKEGFKLSLMNRLIKSSDLLL